jgi:deazaflavin-dependent oxidoreductase (nitroreductase family)
LTVLWEVAAVERAHPPVVDNTVQETPGFGPAGPPHFSRPIRALARSVNPVASHLAGTRWFPLWAIVRHTGRKSGTAFATPVVARPTADGFVIPLPFGDVTQWARNLFAAGGGAVRFAGREFDVTDPRIVDLSSAGPELNPVLRFAAGRLGIRHWVKVQRVR